MVVDCLVQLDGVSWKRSQVTSIFDDSDFWRRVRDFKLLKTVNIIIISSTSDLVQVVLQDGRIIIRQNGKEVRSPLTALKSFFGSWFDYFVRFFTTWSYSSSGFAGWQRGRCEKRGTWPCSLAKGRQIQKKETNQGDFQSTCSTRSDHFIKEWTRLGWSWKKSRLVDWLASGLISWLRGHRASFWFVQLIKVFRLLVPNFQRYSSTRSREQGVQRGAGNRCQNGHIKGHSHNHGQGHYSGS